RLLAAGRDAPPAEVLDAALAADGGDLRARHLLAVRHLLDGREEAGLEHLIEMLRRDRQFEDGLARRTLIDAFRVVQDDELVGRYRRKMSSLLF
ncbi:MAG TPA: tetratricopeptide repeat protein, partial [Lysobacter sp.]